MPLEMHRAFFDRAPYLHRPARAAYVVAFNTDASSKSRARPRITRDVDDAVRDQVLEELTGR